MREIRGEGRNLACLLSSPSPLSLLTRWLCYYFDRKEMKTRRFMIYVKIQRKSVTVDENQSETVKIKTNFNSNGIVPQKFQNNASFFGDESPQLVIPLNRCSWHLIVSVPHRSKTNWSNSHNKPVHSFTWRSRIQSNSTGNVNKIFCKSCNAIIL